MEWAMLLLASVLLLSWGGGYYCRRPGSWLYILDEPNHRSLHVRPVPRSGGVAVVLAILAGGAILAFYSPNLQDAYGFTLGFLVIALVGLLDDFHSLKARYRLLAQCLCAGLLLQTGVLPQFLNYPGGSLQLPMVAAALLGLLFVVWLVNLYNFMDGMDGLAGSMAVFGFSTFVILGWQAGDLSFAVANGVIVMAALGFLFHNLPPARLFLGDAGAYGLGFLCAGMLLLGEKRAIFPLWIGVLVFSPFIVDATFTLLLRLFRGERVWEAHRDHAYQTAVQIGLGHRGTLRWAQLIMLGVALTGLVLNRAESLLQWVLLTMWGGFYLGLFWYLRKKRYNQKDMGSS